MITINIPEPFVWFALLWAMISAYRSFRILQNEQRIKKSVREIAKGIIVTSVKKTIPPGAYDITWREREEENA